MHTCQRAQHTLAQVGGNVMLWFYWRQKVGVTRQPERVPSVYRNPVLNVTPPTPSFCSPEKIPLASIALEEWFKRPGQYLITFLVPKLIRHLLVFICIVYKFDPTARISWLLSVSDSFNINVVFVKGNKYCCHTKLKGTNHILSTEVLPYFYLTERLRGASLDVPRPPQHREHFSEDLHWATSPH